MSVKSVMFFFPSSMWDTVGWVSLSRFVPDVGAAGVAEAGDAAVV